MNHEHILWLSLSDLSVPCVQTLWEDSLIYLGLIVLHILCYSFIAVSSRRSLRSLLRCIVCSPLWEDSHNTAQSRCSSCCFLGWSGGANYNITTGIRCSTANIQSTVDLQKNKKKAKCVPLRNPRKEMWHEYTINILILLDMSTQHPL